MLIGDIPRTDLAHRLRNEGLHLDTGAFTTHLQIELPELVDEFAAMYAQYPVDDPPEIDDFRVRIAAPSLLRRFVRPQAQAWIDGDDLIEPMQRDHAYPALESSLNLCVATNDLNPLVIHSAVLERDGRALIMPAPSGSGKSTLCATLAWRGWRLLSDEMAVFCLEDGRLRPNPRPVSLKNRAVDIVAAFEPRARFTRVYEGTNKGDIAFMEPPPGAVARAKEKADPGLVVVPTYIAGAPATLREMGKSEAFRWLVDNALNYSSMLRTGFDTLTGVVERCGLYLLRYSNLDEAIDLIDRLHRERLPTIPPGLTRRARDSLLLGVLREPGRTAGFAPRTWNELLLSARQYALLARLAARLEETGLFDRAPYKARLQMRAASIAAASSQTAVGYELNRVLRALRGIDVPVIVLKGSAYVAARLPAARGRFVGDLDVMVPLEQIDEVERTLIAKGWAPAEMSAYDQHYYREWMHEVPPLQHPERETPVDLHHTIAPRTARVSPDAAALFAASVPLAKTAPGSTSSPSLRVLAPADMVLHSAVHLFNDEVGSPLRDLFDLDDLLRDFGARPGFWDELLARARLHGLTRPLYYLLRHTQRVPGTPIPPEVVRAAAAFAPGPVVNALMDWLFAYRFGCDPTDRIRPGTGFAAWLLYLRAHWLRMPMGMLARHLSIKAVRRMREGMERKAE